MLRSVGVYIADRCGDSLEVSQVINTYVVIVCVHGAVKGGGR